MNPLCFFMILSVCLTIFEPIEGRRRQRHRRSAQVDRVSGRLAALLSDKFQLKEGKSAVISRSRRDEYGDGTGGSESETHIEKSETKVVGNEVGNYEDHASKESGVEVVKKMIYENSLMNFGDKFNNDGGSENSIVVKKSLDQVDQNHLDLDQVDQNRDKSTTVQNLIAESARLGQELRVVFSDLTSREETLLKEMEELRGALQNAIKVMKDRDTKMDKVVVVEQDTKNVVSQRDMDVKAEAEDLTQAQDKSKKVRKTRTAEDILNEEELYMGELDMAAHEPYRACVYINPEFGEEREVIRTDETIVHKSVDGKQLPPIVQHDTFPTSETIDLSTVMWVKLPLTNEDAIDVSKKVNIFLRDMIKTQHDVLIIPVSNKFTNPQQVMRNLLESLYAITPSHKPTAADSTSTQANDKKLKKSKVDLKEQKLRISQI